MPMVRLLEELGEATTDLKVEAKQREAQFQRMRMSRHHR